MQKGIFEPFFIANRSPINSSSVIPVGIWFSRIPGATTTVDLTPRLDYIWLEYTLGAGWCTYIYTEVVRSIAYLTKL